MCDNLNLGQEFILVSQINTFQLKVILEFSHLHISNCLKFVIIAVFSLYEAYFTDLASHDLNNMYYIQTGERRDEAVNNEISVIQESYELANQTTNPRTNKIINRQTGQ